MRKYVLAFCMLAFSFLSLSVPSFAATNPDSTGYTVQVSACRQKASADIVVKALRKEGYTPYIHEISGSGGNVWYVVRLGDYRTLKEAESAAGAFFAREGKEAVVTSASSMKVLARGEPGLVHIPLEIEKSGPGTGPETQETKPSEPGNTMSEATMGKANEKKPVEKQVQVERRETARVESAEPGAKEDTGAPPATEKASEPAGPPVTATQKEAPEPVAQQENVQKAPEKEAPQTPAVSAPPATQLEERIKTIEKELKTLREQAEARKKLEITTKEKEQKEKEVLSAAGRQYTLLGKGTLGAEYSFSYAYYSYDVLREAASIEHHSNHNLTNAVYIEYALLDNLTFNSNLPFVYKYDRSGTSESKDVNDLGDVSVGVQWQPVKTGGRFPAAIFQATFTLPSGRSPYDINPEQELSTGLGYYSAGAGVTLSQTIDPIVAFGSVNYSHNFNIRSLDQHYSSGRVLTGVDPGDAVTLNLGIGYALSYKVSLNLSYQYSYYFSTSYHWQDAGATSAAAYSSSIFSVGTGWRISPKRSIYLKVGIGLTNDDPDFTFSFRLPFQFAL
jgi:hypothetical protein